MTQRMLMTVMYDPTYVNDSYVLLPQELAGDPQVDTPQFWNFLSNWLNFL